jgi:hypothetical protein
VAPRDSDVTPIGVTQARLILCEVGRLIVELTNHLHRAKWGAWAGSHQEAITPLVVLVPLEWGRRNRTYLPSGSKKMSRRRIENTGLNSRTRLWVSSPSRQQQYHASMVVIRVAGEARSLITMLSTRALGAGAMWCRGRGTCRILCNHALYNAGVCNSRPYVIKDCRFTSVTYVAILYGLVSPIMSNKYRTYSSTTDCDPSPSMSGSQASACPPRAGKVGGMYWLVRQLPQSQLPCYLGHKRHGYLCQAL